MNEKTMARDLTTGSPIKQLIAFSIPFVLSNLLQQAYTLTDMVIVGQFLGSVGLTAANAGVELAMFYLLACLGFSSAGQIIIAQNVGAGNIKGLKNTIGTMFTVQFILGAVLTLVAIATCGWFMRLLNVPEEAYRDAYVYSVVLFSGQIPVFCYNAIAAVLRGMGDSKRPMIFVAISSVLNIALDIIFVGPLGMGCFGAALATVIAQVAAFIVSVAYIYRHRARFGFDFKLRSFAIDKAVMKNLISLGLPISLQNAAVSVSLLYIASYINDQGVVAASATAVANKVTVFATVCTLALQTGGSSIIAQSFAAGKHRRVVVTTGYILLIGTIFCAVLSVLLVSFPKQIFSVFDNNPEVLALAPLYAPIGAVGFIGFATRSAAMAFINGTGFSTLALVTGILDGIAARIGLSILFGLTLDMGISGFWLGSALAGHIFGIVGLIYFLSGSWKRRRLLVERDA